MRRGGRKRTLGEYEPTLVDELGDGIVRHITKRPIEHAGRWCLECRAPPVDDLVGINVTGAKRAWYDRCGEHDRLDTEVLAQHRHCNTSGLATDHPIIAEDDMCTRHELVAVEALLTLAY